MVCFGALSNDFLRLMGCEIALREALRFCELVQALPAPFVAMAQGSCSGWTPLLRELLPTPLLTSTISTSSSHGEANARANGSVMASDGWEPG